MVSQFHAKICIDKMTTNKQYMFINELQKIFVVITQTFLYRQYIEIIYYINLNSLNSLNIIFKLSHVGYSTAANIWLISFILSKSDDCGIIQNKRLFHTHD